MTVFIHIGLPKAASTTIQGILDKNRATLISRGYNVKTTNFCHVLASRLRGLEPEVRFDPDGFEESLRDLSGNVVMSSEMLLLAGGVPGALDELFDRFDGGDVQVLAIVRNPADLLESTWFQWIRTYRHSHRTAENMRRWGFEVGKYIEEGWFSLMNDGWLAWKNHPRVAAFDCIYLDLEPAVSLEGLLSGHLGNTPLEGLGANSKLNKSVNGVTFRLLNENRDVDVRSYGAFVNNVDGRLNDAGFESYRYLLGDERKAVNSHFAERYELFRPYVGYGGKDRPSAREMTDEALEKASAIFRDAWRKHAGADGNAARQRPGNWWQRLTRRRSGASGKRRP